MDQAIEDTLTRVKAKVERLAEAKEQLDRAEADFDVILRSHRGHGLTDRRSDAWQELKDAARDFPAADAIALCEELKRLRPLAKAAVAWLEGREARKGKHGIGDMLHPELTDERVGFWWAVRDYRAALAGPATGIPSEGRD
jgi:hypothetical protein